MAKWGRGWEANVRRSELERAVAIGQAARTLQGECGVTHQLGDRRDLCPVCIAVRGKAPSSTTPEIGR